ncbi:MAG TPA: FAD:protein FMN transferase [Bacteroidetes bacterium]|nr:FAD:protein FMN transferase [Candidatus Limimorpha avicola]
MMKKTVSILIMMMILTSCNAPERKQYTGVTQGSYYSVIYYDERDFSDEIDSILKDVENSVSLWQENSIIRKVNENKDVIVDKIFIDNFNWAVKAAEFSDGLFDATIAPLVSAWGFHYKKEIALTDKMIDSILELVDYRKIRIEEGRVIKDNENMSLDFNAVAQGYTADIIGEYLYSQGINNYLVDIGGEITAKGVKPNGETWKIGIEKPAPDKNAERVIQMKIELKDKAVVTSGSYRKYIEKDNVRYSHSIDPRTGQPVEHNLLSATIIADNAAWADCLASICMIAGMEKASELLKNEDVEALFIYLDDENQLQTFQTEGFEKMIVH